MPILGDFNRGFETPPLTQMHDVQHVAEGDGLQGRNQGKRRNPDLEDQGRSRIISFRRAVPSQGYQDVVSRADPIGD